ncbi:zinc finger protein 397 [Drosophila obscura]|uniref:zinc finger protein 397 n=1 Tax=Drosophila obscura TaxID=7282 RepID=UPI001BB20224|nr:zinc finger protein 397 [Drosophila obscura]
MEVCTDFINWGRGSIEACRTCGTYFDTDDGLIKPIFEPTTGVEAKSDVGMAEILKEMGAWNLLVTKEDGRPQYMCISCIAEFQRLLKFKCSCLETHEQYVGHQLTSTGINIKKELDHQSEEKFCGFIYLDSDEEVSDEDGSRRVSAAFDMPHVPIKEEHMARVPAQQSEMKFVPPQPQALLPPLPPVAVKTEDDYEFKFQIAPEEKLDPDAGGIPYASASNANAMSYDSGGNPNAISYENESQSNAAISYENENESDEEEVVKFTYDDDEDATTIPQPIKSTSVLCKICFHEFPSQELQQTHMQHMHLFKDWECHLCGKKFINSKESLIKLHIKFHKLQRRLKCPICGFFCNSKETLKEHKRAVHSRTVCQYCGKVMKPNMLQSHMMKHMHEREAALAQKLTSAESPGTSASDQRLMPVECFGPISSPKKKLKVVNHIRPPAAAQKLTIVDQPETSSAGQKHALMRSPVPFSSMPSAEKKLKFEELTDASPIQKQQQLDEGLPVTFSPITLHSPVQQHQQLHSPVQQQQQLHSPLEQQQQLHSPFEQQQQKLPTEEQEQEDQHKTEDSPLVNYSPVMPICVIQCAFCSDNFEEAQQLQDHVLAKHKDMNSPPPKTKPPPLLRPSPKAMDIDMDTDDTSSQSDSTISAKERSSTLGVSQNSSSRSYNSSNNDSYNKSYCKCHICGKPFDLKIKLNRHLKQHNKAPF